jgi:predicted PurR-regulated permease PerM
MQSMPRAIFWLVALFVAWQLRFVMLLVFAALLFAVFLDALSRILRGIVPIGRSASICAVMIVLVLVISTGIYYWGPALVDQFRDLGQNVSERALQLYKQIARADAVALDPADLIQWLPTPGNVASGAGAVLNSALAAVSAVLISFVLGVYIAVMPDALRHFATQRIGKFAPRLEARIQNCLRTLRLWLAGQALSMTVIGVANLAVLSYLDVPYAGALAIFAGIAAFIPYLGPIIGFVPIILVASGVSLATVAWVAALYLVVQVLESYLLTPMVQSRAISVPAPVIIVGQLVFGALFGIAGIALATPLTAAAFSLSGSPGHPMEQDS